MCFKLFLILFFPNIITAQNYITTNMDEIIVKDSTDKEMFVFSKKEIEKSKNIYLPDILRYEPDVNVNRRAISGDIGDMLSIRGLSGSRILLNLNGRSINAAGVVGGYYNDFSIIPLDMIEKIQLIKGGSDLKYGNNALGGVINVITKQPKDRLDFSYFSGFSFSRYIDYMFNNRISVSNKVGKIGYLFSASHQKNDEYLWNNDFEAKNFGLGLHLDMPYDSKLIFLLQYTNTERGFIRKNRKSDDPTNPLFYQRYNLDYPLAFGDTLNPYGGNVSIPGPGAYWIKEKSLLDLAYKMALDDWFIETRIYKNFENRFEYNYSTKIVSSTYTNPDGTLIFKRKVESDRSWGANIDISREWNKNFLNSGFEYKHLGYGDIKVYYVDMSYGCFGITCIGGPASQSADVYAFYLKDEYKLNDRLSIGIGLRYDDYEVNRENNSNVKEFHERLWSISSNVNYNLAKNHNLMLSVYKKYRTPTMPEVYWWSNNQLGYNKTLKSEKNNAMELSYKTKFERNIFEFTAYNYDIDDYIMFRFDPKRGAYNISNVNIKGLSVSYKADFDEIKPYLNITSQRTKKGYDFYDQAKLTDKLDYLPKFKINTGLEYKINKDFIFIGNYRYNDVSTTLYSWKVGPNTNYKLINLKSYDVFDIELKYIRKNLIASFYVDNLFNERYEERFGYPINERLFGTSLSVKF